MCWSPLIALVDDDASPRSALETLLGSLGCRSVAFESALSFLASADAGCCHCVISDVSMPGMSGFDLPQQLRRTGRKVPVILITGRAELGLFAQAEASGAHSLLAKPFDVKRLIACLAEARAA